MSTAIGPQPPSPAPEPAPAVQGAPGVPPRRRRGSWVDLVRTMLVVLAFVVLIVLLVPRPGEVPRPKADVVAAAAAAKPTLGLDPLLPAGLPGTWQATSAGTRKGVDAVQSFHLDYSVDVGPVYAGVDQATSVTPRWIEVNTAGGEKVGDVTIDGVVWQQFFDADEQYTSLLLQRPDRVVLVTSKNGGTEVVTVLARALAVPAA